MECFCDLFPVRLTLASNRVSCWHCPALPETQMVSALCSSVCWSLQLLLWVCCARSSNSHSPLNPAVSFLHLAGGRASLVLVVVFTVYSLLVNASQSPLKIKSKSSSSAPSGELPTRDWSSNVLQ